MKNIQGFGTVAVVGKSDIIFVSICQNFGKNLFSLYFINLTAVSSNFRLRMSAETNLLQRRDFTRKEKTVFSPKLNIEGSRISQNFADSKGNIIYSKSLGNVIYSKTLGKVEERRANTIDQIFFGLPVREE